MCEYIYMYDCICIRLYTYIHAKLHI
jgi:hypothetical protein